MLVANPRLKDVSMNMIKKTPSPHRYQALMRYARILGYGEIHTKIDPESGLFGIIAIHNTSLGPAIGGCRFLEYDSSEHALKDVLRLAYMMTLKAAVSDLPHGGAKSVIFKPKVIPDRAALFRSFGNFVHEMNGRYIVAIDVNTSTSDMNIIAEQTPYVIGATTLSNVQGDPALHTAQGVLRGIEAAVQFQLNKTDLNGVHVAVQGAGKVGSDLVRQLIEKGARVTVSDFKAESAEKLREQYGVETVHHEKIYDVACDVFSPCALGGTINLDTLNRLKTTIVAGSANNQLAHNKYGRIMHDKGILYAPDYVINAGGLINAAMVYDFADPDLANRKIDTISDILLNIFKRSKQENIATNKVAELIAIERLKQANQPSTS
ncbi:MAG: NAD(P)-binding domain-containing protein [Gammaproteobacteria bacterium]|nr:NAD(P)-binding domain-containing protein [Gammaproteobacteria bacterium]